MVQLNENYLEVNFLYLAIICNRLFPLKEISVVIQIGCRFWDLALREHASTNKVSRTGGLCGVIVIKE